MSLELNSFLAMAQLSARISIYFLVGKWKCRQLQAKQLDKCSKTKKIVKKFFVLPTTGSICKFPQA